MTQCLPSPSWAFSSSSADPTPCSGLCVAYMKCYSVLESSASWDHGLLRTKLGVRRWEKNDKYWVLTLVCSELSGTGKNAYNPFLSYIYTVKQASKPKAATGAAKRLGKAPDTLTFCSGSSCVRWLLWLRWPRLLAKPRGHGAEHPRELLSWMTRVISLSLSYLICKMAIVSNGFMCLKRSQWVKNLEQSQHRVGAWQTFGPDSYPVLQPARAKQDKSQTPHFPSRK